ncbi:MAG: DUF255 domain-containing protein [Chlorobi bacterium]|nr:DUF255 domain-containing protein [Chlorobiota bacterium]
MLLPVHLQAQKGGVKWLTIEKALELNKKEPRKLFIDVYTDWCGWCKKMDQSTYMDPVIADILNNNFYPVKFNAESKDPVEFAGKTFTNPGTSQRSAHQLAFALLQGKMAYPSVAYLDEKLQLLTTVPGYFTAQQMEPILTYFSTDSYKTMTWQQYQESFKGQLSKK